MDESLRYNENQFVIHYDLYKTLEHIIYYNSPEKISNKRGYSLLNKIPVNRNCKTEKIKECACF